MMAMTIRLTEFVWSAELAYVVGLMATDGNLSPDGRHFDFTSKDYEQVALLKQLLNLDNRICQKPNGRGDLAYRIQFGNVALYRWLLDIGLMPNKSKVLGSLAVPDAYFFDFLRGHLDGDGTISIYNDPQYPNSRRLYTRFLSASLPHLQWLQATLDRLLGISGAIDQKTRVWSLTLAKSDSLTLLPHLYYQSDLPCLQRKKAQLAEFLNL
jgi:hypothetical protein